MTEAENAKQLTQRHQTGPVAESETAQKLPDYPVDYVRLCEPIKNIRNKKSNTEELKILSW